MTTKAISARPGSKTMYRPPPTMTLRPASAATATIATWFLKSTFMKKARSLSEKWRFMTKKRRCSDCVLVLPMAASISASSSGRRARISIWLPSRRSSRVAYLLVSDIGDHVLASRLRLRSASADEARAGPRSFDLDQDYCARVAGSLATACPLPDEGASLKTLRQYLPG